MNEHLHMAHKNFHTKPCASTAPDAHAQWNACSSHKLNYQKTFIPIETNSSACCYFYFVVPSLFPAVNSVIRRLTKCAWRSSVSKLVKTCTLLSAKSIDHFRLSILLVWLCNAVDAVSYTHLTLPTSSTV